MSKHTQVFDLPIGANFALTYCQEVSAQMDWRVLALGADRISIKEIASKITGFTWPARIDVVIQTLGVDKCRVSLFGSITGAGPIQRNHLQGQMGRFLNQLSLLTDRHSQNSAPIDNDRSFSEEIARLKKMHDEGVLTDEEFSAAKARLLA